MDHWESYGMGGGGRSTKNSCKGKGREKIMQHSKLPRKNVLACGKNIPSTFLMVRPFGRTSSKRRHVRQNKYFGDGGGRGCRGEEVGGDLL